MSKNIILLVLLTLAIDLPILPESMREEIFRKQLINSSSVLNNQERYQPWLIFDGDNNTGWSEGNKNDGIGEWVEIKIENPKDPLMIVEILPGLAKSDKLYKENNRPKLVRVDIFYEENDILESKNIELTDDRVFQSFRLDDRKEYPDNCTALMTIRFTVLSIYKGTKYNDTCISEIRMFSKSGDEIVSTFRKRFLMK